MGSTPTYPAPDALANVADHSLLQWSGGEELG